MSRLKSTFCGSSAGTCLADTTVQIVKQTTRQTQPHRRDAVRLFNFMIFTSSILLICSFLPRPWPPFFEFAVQPLPDVVKRSAALQGTSGGRDSCDLGCWPFADGCRTEKPSLSDANIGTRDRSCAQSRLAASQPILARAIPSPSSHVLCCA